MDLRPRLQSSHDAPHHIHDTRDKRHTRLHLRCAAHARLQRLGGIRLDHHINEHGTTTSPIPHLIRYTAALRRLWHASPIVLTNPGPSNLRWRAERGSH